MYNYQLAQIHDKGFKDLSLNVTKLILNEIPYTIGPIVDLGCGWGDLLLHFRDKVQFGYGYDRSEEMIEFCKVKIPEYHFEVSDFFESDFPDAQIITMIGETLSYASSEVSDIYNRLKIFFKMVSSKLSRNGIFLFDFLVDGNDFDYINFHDTSQYTIVMNSRLVNNTVSREIVSFLTDGELYTKSIEKHELKVFNLETIIVLLKNSGFEVVTLDSYGPSRLLPGRKACLCRLK